MDYLRPTDLQEALTALAGGGWTPLAGGTDHYPALGGRRETRNLLDVTAIAALRGIVRDEHHWRIGALTTWSELLRHPLPAAFDGLKQAAREVGSVQIQNRATIAGNLCNASPAADGVPPLLVLDAEVELASRAATRRLPLAQFIAANRKTERRPDELMTAVVVPRASAHGNGAFVKLGARRYLVISIAMAAVRLVLDGQRIAGIAIAVGACSAVAQRLTMLEGELRGQAWNGDLHGAIGPRHLACLSPIDDIRATGDYRLSAVRELIVRAVRQAGSAR